MECGICCDKFNKTKRAPVTCHKCEYQACRECLSRYLLDPSVTIANCPNCHIEWTREFLRESFTLKFINTDLKHHREEVLFQQEKAIMPLRQAAAERKLEIRALEAELLKHQAEMLRVENLVLITRQRILDLKYGKAPEPKNRFIQPCPYENCRGFLSSQWKCGMCNMWTCKSCQECKGPSNDSEHTCDPDKVQSAELIAKETKPCPKCGVRLFRISGCNQMWCTNCNDCAFDWVTGRIETTIHNPHFFEYQRSRPAAAPAPQHACEVFEITHQTPRYINASLQKLRYGADMMSTVRDQVMNLNYICSFYLHIAQVLIPANTINPITYNEKYGISFLLNEITEKEFKIKLQRADKRTQICREVLNVLVMVNETIKHIVMRYSKELHDINPKSTTDPDLRLPGIFQILDETKELVAYGNTCLQKIGEVYSVKTPVLQIPAVPIVH